MYHIEAWFEFFFQAVDLYTKQLNEIHAAAYLRENTSFYDDLSQVSVS